jgi:hypothetical protein
MMVFALLGIFFLKDELKKWRLSIVVFMIVNVYVIFSWWCWWYGGTFGQRSFIESYSLLAIPFASFMQFLSDKKLFYKLLLGGVALFLIWLNIFQTYQFEFHSLHYDGMTKELYFKQFGKLDAITGYDGMARSPNYAEAKKGNDYDSKSPDVNDTQHNLPKINNVINKKETGRKIILLKSSNGKYVSSDGGLNNIIIANRDSAQGWETFTLILFEKDQCAILAYNNKFFCAEIGQQNEITSTRDHVANWETFTLVELENNFVSFKAANGNYLGVDGKSLRLYARSSTIGTQEKFEMIIK